MLKNFHQNVTNVPNLCFSSQLQENKCVLIDTIKNIVLSKNAGRQVDFHRGSTFKELTQEKL